MTLSTMMYADGEYDEREGLFFAICLLYQGINKDMVEEYWNEFIQESSLELDNNQINLFEDFRDLSLSLIDDFEEFAKNHLAKKK